MKHILLRFGIISACGTKDEVYYELMNMKELMDMIPMFVPPLLLSFLTVALVWFVRRALFARRGLAPHDPPQVEPTKNDDVASHPSNPFIHDDVPEAGQPSIVVQSPIPPKKEFFVMRADSKTASIFGGESSDMIARQGEIVDMGDMSQEKSKKTIEK